ncbi:MAG: hypothetical protein KC417_00760 [Myxococcales bacterium]|nr:hypothetical protein [Myxococcales bacterium]
MTRVLPLRARGFGPWAWLPLLAALTACDGLGLDGEPNRANGGTGNDSGDAGAVLADGGYGSEVESPDLLPSVPDGVFGNNGDAERSYCFAGQPGEPFLLDCEATSCAASGACCVGSKNCCAEDQTKTRSIDASGCAVGPAANCVSGVTPFGTPAPVVTDGAVLPAGSMTSDSGLVFDNAVALEARRLELTVTFKHSTCSGACLEAAGVGVTTQSSFDVSSVITPKAALVSRGAARTVALLIEGVLAAEWSVDAALADTSTWTLTLAPTGEVSVVGSAANGTNALAVGYADVYAPAPEARVVLYGRNANGETSTRAGVRMLDVRESVCDVPAAWSERGPLGGADPSLADAGAPSVATHGDETWIAYEAADGIHVGVLAGATVTAEPGVAVGAEPSQAFRAKAVQDPELVRNADDDGWLLFFTAERSGGARSIGRAVRLDGATAWSVDSVPVLEPNALVIPTAEPAIDVDAPTVMRNASRQLVMIVRGRSASATWFDVLRSSSSSDGQAWHPLTPPTTAGGEWAAGSPSPLATLTLRDGSVAGTPFDRDQLGAPSLHEQNRSFHLYYAGRRGSRWAIGLATTDDLFHWRFVGDGSAAVEHGASGFDASGVADPDVEFREGIVTLVHTGIAGSSRALGVLRREAATVAVPEAP